MIQSQARPGGMMGIRHVALFVHNLDECLLFYRDVIGMREAWQPDPDNIYLTSGSDTLALHRLDAERQFDGPQRLDHIGFVMETADDVDAWHQHLLAHNTKIAQAPKFHRDGARSLYCFDPAGNLLQFIYYQPISDLAQASSPAI